MRLDHHCSISAIFNAEAIDGYGLVQSGNGSGVVFGRILLSVSRTSSKIVEPEP
ncbi:unnamed protein product [Rhodiola kirilowii]